MLNAMRLTPLDPELFRLQTEMALAHFFAGRLDEAAGWAEKALGHQPSVQVAAATHRDVALLQRNTTAQQRQFGAEPDDTLVGTPGDGCMAALVLAGPGNDDIPLFDLWARLRRPYGRYSAAFGIDLEPVHRPAEVLVICVNTTRPWRHKDGEVLALQIDRVARLVGQPGLAQLRGVVVHQPIAFTRAEDEPNRLRGHAAALQAWTEAGTDLVMGDQHLAPLRHAAARPGASAVGRAGGHGRLVPSA